MPKPTVVIDGSQFQTMEGFFEHFQDMALDGAKWGSNLDSFNDVLRGGFGTPEHGFILVWRNHAASQQQLGYEETVRQLERRLTTCHPVNRKHVSEDLEAAKRQSGPTVYDWLVEIIHTHGAGGAEGEDGVELQLA